MDGVSRETDAPEAQVEVPINRFLVATISPRNAQAEWDICFNLPVPRRMTKAEALELAAWIVVLADDGAEPKFGRLLRAVMES